MTQLERLQQALLSDLTREAVTVFRTLTKREREAARHFYDGLTSTKEIANVLGVAEKTAEFHLTSMREKLCPGCDRTVLMRSVYPLFRLEDAGLVTLNDCIWVPSALAKEAVAEEMAGAA